MSAGTAGSSLDLSSVSSSNKMKLVSITTQIGRVEEVWSVPSSLVGLVIGSWGAENRQEKRASKKDLKERTQQSCLDSPMAVQGQHGRGCQQESAGATRSQAQD